MPTTISSVTLDANALYDALSTDLSVDLTLPDLDLVTEFPPIPETGLPEVDPLTIGELTSGTVEGTGVFDELMQAVNAHLAAQFDRNRIVGNDYAKVYLGSMTAVMQFGTQFLLEKDRRHLDNLQLIEQIKLAHAQRLKAAAELQLIRAQIQGAQLTNTELQLRAYTSRNQYVSSKMDLVLGFNSILEAEGKQKLINAQYENAHAQIHDLLPDGSPVGGVTATDKAMKLAQSQLISEQYEAARASVRDTLSTGDLFGGLIAVEKLTKEAQRDLVKEQVDTARAQTKDTNKDGTPITGVAAAEKTLRNKQATLVSEQTEAQRGQTRGTLSTGEPIVGLVGAQTKLYEQQVVSYKRDAESKGLKMLLDTWTARKTIDEGVTVPVAIDTPALESAVTAYRANLEI